MQAVEKRRNRWVSLGASAMLALGAASASAGVITFNFGSDGGLSGSGDSTYYSATKSGVTVTATGWEGSCCSSDQEEITRTTGADGGLGVNSDDDGSSSQVDGDDGAEWIKFTFTLAGVLTGIDFSS